MSDRRNLDGNCESQEIAKKYRDDDKIIEFQSAEFGDFILPAQQVFSR